MLPRVLVSSSDRGVDKPTKRCGVCSDIAKSFHFGGLACDSCKAFFRRSVQNEAFRAFQCAFRQRCDITVQSRKCCQHCRFRKCSSIGMEIGWVMTEEERMDMLRTRMEKKLQRHSNGSANIEPEQPPAKKRKLQVRVHHQRRRDVLKSIKDNSKSSPVHDHEPLPEADDHRSPPEDGSRWPHSPTDGPVFALPMSTKPELLDADQKEIERLTRTFGLWFKLSDRKCLDGSREWTTNRGQKPEWLLVLLFMISVQKLVKFALGISRFTALSTEDQMKLLRANVFEMFLAVHFHQRGAACLYPACHRPVSVGSESSKDVDSGDADDGVREMPYCPFLMSVDEGLAYGKRFSALVQDAQTLVLLLAVILFCPDAAAASSDNGSASVIESCRMHFCRLLDARLTTRFGQEKRAVMFPRLLLLLPTLREIRDKRLFYRFDVGLCRDLDLDAAYGSL